MKDVFVGRMSGPMLSTEQIDLMLTWIDGQPRPSRAAPVDRRGGRARPRALQRHRTRRLRLVPLGRRLHATTRPSTSAPARSFQVPSLLGVGTRGPFMHDGCAKTLPTASRRLRRRQTGAVDHRSAAQLSDLIAFLKSSDAPLRSHAADPGLHVRPDADVRRHRVARRAVGLAAARFGKPERWVMTALVPGLMMTFAGNRRRPRSSPSRTSAA